MRIALFLEDIGHEGFVDSLVRRLADQEGVRIEVDVRNARGGAPQLDQQFDRFLKDYSVTGMRPDLVVVVRDTDCAGVRTIQSRYSRLVKDAGYLGDVVIGAPEPHIECWYLADPSALQRVLSAPTQAPVPDSRCGTGRFKEMLARTVTDAKVDPLLGGIEYAEDIVADMDIYRAAANVPSFDTFVQDLRRALRGTTHTGTAGQ